MAQKGGAEIGTKLNKILSPATVTFLVSLLYLAAVIIGAGGDPLALARIGTQYREGDIGGSEGYDGQFVYYIAQDPNPENVEAQIDVPAYRYQRILLPMLARVLSLASAKLIPWMIPLISLAAHTAAVFLLSKLLEKWSLNRWYALSYGLWLGFLLAMRLDLPEALAFALVIAAVFLEVNGKSRSSWLFYAFALFAKETTLFFLGAQLLVYLFHRRLREFVGLGIVAILPFAVFQIWLLNTFGHLGLSSGGIRATPMEWIPFMGIWRIREYGPQIMIAFFAIYLPILVIPSLWALWSSAKQFARDGIEFSSLALFLNAAIIPFLPFSLYSEPYGAMRLASGLVFALILFAARYKNHKVLNFTLFWILLNLILVAEFFGLNI